MKTALVLFCGTKSIDRSLQELGFHVDSLDINPKCHATWTCNILDWDYQQFEPGTYDFIWASPDCTQYSRCRTTAKTPRNLELADSLVAKALEIIRFLKPKAYLIKNPQTGLLKTREVVQDIPWHDVCYCQYSNGINHRYRKATRLWGYLPTLVPRAMCTKKNPCNLMTDGKHPTSAQRFSGTSQNPYKHSLKQLHSMPKQLTDDIAKAVVELLGQTMS